MADNCPVEPTTPTPAGQSGRWLSVSRAAALLGVTAHTLREWTRQGVIHASRTAGGHRRYDRDDVLRFVQAAGSGASLHDIHERVLELTTVADSAQQVFDELEPREVLRSICLRLMEALHCTTAVVSLYNAELDAVVTQADYNADGKETPPSDPYLLVDYPSTARVIREQRPLLVNVSDPDADPAEVAVLNLYGNRSLLVLPLIHRGESIGIVELIDRPRERHYSEAELELARRLCSQAAIAMSNAHAYDELRRHVEELAIMDRSLEVITRRLDLGELLNELAYQLAQGLDVCRVYVYDRDAKSGVLSVAARAVIRGEESNLREIGSRIPADPALACYRAMAAKTVTYAAVTDFTVNQHSREEMEARGELSAMYVPIIFEEQVIGVIANVATRRVRRFTRGDERLAVNIATKAGIAIHNAGAVTQLRRQNQELTLLLETSTAVSQSMELQTTLNAIAEFLTTRLDASWSDVYAYDPATDEVEVIAFYQLVSIPLSIENWLGARFSPDRWPDWRRCIEKRTASIWDYSRASAAERAEADQWHERATLTVPLIFKGELIGLLDIADVRDSRHFTQDDVRLVLAIAGQAVVAIHNARLFEETNRHNSEAQLLLEAATAIGRSVALDETLDTITRLLMDKLSLAWSNIYDYDPVSGSVKVIAYNQLPEVPPSDDWVGKAFHYTDYPDWRVCIEERRAVASYADDPDLFTVDEDIERWGDQATLTVPLIYQDELFGLLDVAESRHLRRFTADDERIVTAIAGQAAVAIHNARLFEQTSRHNVELSTLLRAAETITSSVDLNRVLSSLMEQLRDALAISTAEIYDYDALRRRLTLVGRDPDGDGAAQVTFYDLEDSPMLARCIDEKRPLVSFIDDPELPEATRIHMNERGYQSRLIVPMVYSGQVVGMIYLADRGAMRLFGEEDTRLASAIAAQGAAAIENARAYAREQLERGRLAEFNSRLTVMVELSGQIRGLVAEDELLRLLGIVMSDTLGFRRWAAFVHDREHGVFRCPAAVGLPVGGDSPGAAAAAEAARGGGAPGIAVPETVLTSLLSDATRVSSTLFVDHRVHVWTDEETAWLPTPAIAAGAEDDWQTGDALFVPMIGDKGQLIGYIEACDPLDGRLPDEQIVKLLEVFVAKAASNVELRHLYDQLAEQAITDGLTGLYNHRHLDERLENEVAKAVRYRTPLSVLMIDIDDFKPFNDTYGHPAGDSLLRELADIMRESTRQKVDLISRYGGEEFVVVLPNTGGGAAEGVADRPHGEIDSEPSQAAAAAAATAAPTAALASAEVVAERIRTVTEKRHFEGFTSRRDANVTVSIGIASYPEHGETALELLANSDKALYLAKRLGKNCTITYHS